MRIFLYGTSAFAHWLTTPAVPRAEDLVGVKALIDCRPTAEAVTYLHTHYPALPLPLHFTVDKRVGRTPLHAVAHLNTFPLAGKPFVRIGNGVHAASPELCFVQMARELPFPELVKVGSALCGSYRIDARRRNQLADRPPLTTRAKIERFLERNPGITGAKQARRAVKLLAEKTASPPEAFLAVLLGADHRYGGFHLPDLEVNRRMTPGSKAQAIASQGSITPDLVHRATKLAIEYDSNSEHLTPRQIAKDARRRLALEAQGYKVITVTARQLGNRFDMQRIATEVARHLGRELRPQGKNFPQRQAELFQAGWSLSAYLNPCWLTGQEIISSAAGLPQS
ncbi:hypothetical protein PZH32_07640 [Adlercreutzia equolifaciens]|uniref:hypothetical protein n=1 Tax=Adlercreutzia equolifaciens TaxID=446660 RepID=UPI0023B1EBD9|nr:hypothetical protein [Adlercreutzia equolifaciens]MDE8702837.1 hypothetical protein [Adlercreutzia equolifaciens]